MANGQQWINTTRLRDYMGVYSHAMPIVVADVESHWGLKFLVGFTLVFAQGRSVPISRGSPPISG